LRTVDLDCFAAYWHGCNFPWPDEIFATKFLEASTNSPGGRRAQARGEKKPPAVIKRIADMLEHETAGDPIKDLKWRRRATRKIAQQLRRLKIRVSASTVRRLLKS
jgi:hypothetical protein